MSEILYQGLIEKAPTDNRDYILGSTSKLPKIILQADRNWLPWKPTKEVQRNNLFDTYGCVSFSRNNCLEIMEKRKYGTEFNRCDRFLVVASGTIPRQGNSMDKVAQTARKHGSVKEEMYPLTPSMTESEYYQAVPEALFVEALTYKDLYEDQYEWVSWGGADKNKMWEALQYGPLQVSIQAYGQYANGVYMPTGTQDTNHLVTLMHADYGKWWKILDHYENEIKTLDWDYYFGAAMRHNIEKRMFKLVKGDQKPEVYVVGADGKLRHIYNEACFEEGKQAGFWGGFEAMEIKPQAEVDALPKGHDVVFSL